MYMDGLYSFVFMHRKCSRCNGYQLLQAHHNKTSTNHDTLSDSYSSYGVNILFLNGMIAGIVATVESI